MLPIGIAMLFHKDTPHSGYCEIVRCGFEITHLVAKPVCFRIKCVCFVDDLCLYQAERARQRSFERLMCIIAVAIM